MEQSVEVEKEWIPAFTRNAQNYLKTFYPDVPPLPSDFTKLPPVKSQSLPKADSYKAESANITREHAKINETLLQLILQLDHIIVDSDLQLARNRRKEAIKKINSLMDNAELLWTYLKEFKGSP